MMCMRSRGADIPRIRAIVLEDSHSGLFKEAAYLAEIIGSPITWKTGGTSEDHASPFSCLRIDYIDFIADPPAGQQGVTAQFYSFGIGIFGKFLEFGNVRFTFILHVQAWTKAEDHHFVTCFGALVDRCFHHLRIGRDAMQEDRVLGCPGSDLPIHPFLEKALPLTVVAIERHQPGTEAFKFTSIRNIFIRPHGQFHFQQARCQQGIITLRSITRIHAPVFRPFRFPFSKTEEGPVAFHMDIRFKELLRPFRFYRRFWFGHSQLFECKFIQRYLHSGFILDLKPFADTGKAVIQGIIQFDFDTFQIIRPFQVERKYFTGCFSRLHKRPAFVCPLNAGR